MLVFLLTHILRHLSVSANGEWGQADDERYFHHKHNFQAVPPQDVYLLVVLSELDRGWKLSAIMDLDKNTEHLCLMYFPLSSSKRGSKMTTTSPHCLSTAFLSCKATESLWLGDVFFSNEKSQIVRKLTLQLEINQTGFKISPVWKSLKKSLFLSQLFQK